MVMSAQLCRGMRGVERTSALCDLSVGVRDLKRAKFGRIIAAVTVKAATRGTTMRTNDNDSKMLEKDDHTHKYTTGVTATKMSRHGAATLCVLLGSTPLDSYSKPCTGALARQIGLTV